MAEVERFISTYDEGGSIIDQGNPIDLIKTRKKNMEEVF